jgi:hypothetical protein
MWISEDVGGNKIREINLGIMERYYAVRNQKLPKL